MLEFKKYLKEVKQEYTESEINQIKNHFEKEEEGFLLAESSFYDQKKKFEDIKAKYLKEKMKFEDIIQTVKII
jgi:hypothetical protein